MIRTLSVPDPDGNPTVGRRAFMGGVLATGGFALAVQPVSAQAIATSAEGLTEGVVAVPSDGDSLPAYRAYPLNAPRQPTIVIAPEIFGIHEHIRDLCRRFAKAGYYAIALEPYARFGQVGGAADIKAVQAIVQRLPDAQALRDFDGAVAFAKSEGADVWRLGFTGFCWGGRVAWLYAAHNPGLKASVAWYGRVGGPTDPLHPKQPIDLVAELKAPVLGLYGGADQGIPVSDVREIEAAAKSAGKTVEIVIYPEAPHAFNADYRPSYRAGPAQDGWGRMMAWFKANGA